jgi:hypothetical protein
MSNMPLPFQNAQEIKNLRKDKLNANIVVPIVSNNPNISNYNGFGNSYYYKTGTRVCVHLGIKVDSTEWEFVFHLPEGCRPYGLVQKTLCGSSLLKSTGVQLSQNGDIYVQTDTSYACGDFEFDAFN